MKNSDEYWRIVFEFPMEFDIFPLSESVIQPDSDLRLQ
jgi:hypothetical protein